MTQIDLEPSAIRELDPKTGRDKRDLSPRAYLLRLLFSLAFLAAIWWNRDAIHHDTLFYLTALIAATAGIFFHGWLKDVY